MSGMSLPTRTRCVHGGAAPPAVIGRDAGLQAGAHRAGVGAGELEEGRGAEALGIDGVEAGRRREVVVEPDPRIQPAERAGAVGARSVAGRAGVADLVTEPVEARG